MSSNSACSSRRLACAAFGSLMSSAAARSMIASFLRWFSTCSASRSAKVSDRRAKNASCAARNRVHNASSTSRAARGVAFHRVISSRIAAAVSRQSLEPDSVSASAISFSFSALAVPRSASSCAKCWPRRRPKASRAAAKRFHSASSVRRSTPLIVFHSSTIARSRSPDAFHEVALSAICSASATSASLAAIASARACSRAAWTAPARSSAATTTASSRLVQRSRGRR